MLESCDKFGSMEWHTLGVGVFLVAYVWASLVLDSHWR